MDKIAGRFQFLLRIIIVLASIGLVFAGTIQLGSYFEDSKEEKTAVTAQIVEHSKKKDGQLFEYEFEGETFLSDPLDDYTKKFGNINDTKQIYVQNSNPTRIFINEKAKGEGVLGSLLLGWGILLALIVLAENRILSILKKGKTEYSDD